MHVSEIWRYPVKSMRGQRLTQSDVLRTGLVGDRSIVVVSRTTGRFITSRTHPGLLGLSAPSRTTAASPSTASHGTAPRHASSSTKPPRSTSTSKTSDPAPSASTFFRCWWQPTALSTLSELIAAAYAPTSSSPALPDWPSANGRDASCALDQSRSRSSS